MRKSASVGDLRERLFSATGGIAACEPINTLSKLAAGGNEDAKDVLAAYVEDGAIAHMRAHACAGLARATKPPHAELAKLFRRGLSDGDAYVRYWSILGYINSAGKGAYEELIRLAENDTVRLEDRAHAVKCLAMFSNQEFDRGLPADPGFWQATDLRLAELRAWATSGYPDGVGYVEPERHPALDKPRTSFERTVQRLDKKLARARRKNQDLAEPSNWLVVADGADISRVKARWNLPSTYLDFLTRFSPLRVWIQSRKFYNGGLQLFGAGDLLKGQDGYSYNPIAKEPILDWPAHLVVIASHGGDPYVLDLSRSDGQDAPVLTAEHGMGEWRFEPAAGSFGEFLGRLGN